MRSVVRHLRRAALAAAGDDLTDAQLLGTFLAHRDASAFEALLRRHGPMVWGVCRRVLGEADAEDAFQATFLVLVRKADSVRPRRQLGGWLYGVACRTTMKARAMSAKRKAKERQAACERCARGPAHAARSELLDHLDVELARLPEKFKEPVILCDLEGKTRKEAARLLGVPEGTICSRLATARKLLAERLSRHGAALPCGALAALLSASSASAGPPKELLAGTGEAAGRLAAGEALSAGAFPAAVVALTEGVVKAMLLSKLTGFWAVALALCVGVGAVGLTYRPAQAAPRPSPAAPDELSALRLEMEAMRKDLQALRERVKTLEGERHSPKSRDIPRTGMDRDPNPDPVVTQKLLADYHKKLDDAKLRSQPLGPVAPGGRPSGDPVPKPGGEGAAARQKQLLDAAQDLLGKLRHEPDDVKLMRQLDDVIQAIKDTKKKGQGSR
jgi:RNA polymerase sigma factor (sigma-70 family)